jgi:hypothetical protein
MGALRMDLTVHLVKKEKRVFHRAAVSEFVIALSVTVHLGRPSKAGVLLFVASYLAAVVVISHARLVRGRLVLKFVPRST